MIRVVRKFSVDLWPQESVGLKGVYSLKFIYLVVDEKLLFTKWYGSGNDGIVCGYKIAI